jgi:hypothetical protein
MSPSSWCHVGAGASLLVAASKVQETITLDGPHRRAALPLLTIGEGAPWQLSGARRWRPRGHLEKELPPPYCLLISLPLRLVNDGGLLSPSWMCGLAFRCPWSSPATSGCRPLSSRISEILLLKVPSSAELFPMTVGIDSEDAQEGWGVWGRLFSVLLQHFSTYFNTI